MENIESKPVQPLAVDFDLAAPLAGFHTLGLLCWPGQIGQENRLAASERWLRRCYEIRMIELAERSLSFFIDENGAGSLNEAFEELNVSFDRAEFLVPFDLIFMNDPTVSREDKFLWYVFESRKAQGLGASRQWWKAKPDFAVNLNHDLSHYYGVIGHLELVILGEPMYAGLTLYIAESIRANSPTINPSFELRPDVSGRQAEGSRMAYAPPSGSLGQLEVAFSTLGRGIG